GDKPGQKGCWTHKYLRQMLSDLGGDGLLLKSLELRLYTARPDLGPNQALADFTEPTFTGYAKKNPLVWGTPLYEDGQVSIMSVSPDPTFACTAAPAEPQVVKGYMVTIADGAGFAVVFAEDIDPVTISDVGNFVTIVPRIVLGTRF